MYCFEAHKCTRYDCPVQRNQIMRCWQYLEAIHQRPVTIDDCPYAPCDKCNYRLGWEIGLIDENLFPEVPDPTPESLVPEAESEPVSEPENDDKVSQGPIVEAAQAEQNLQPQGEPPEKDDLKAPKESEPAEKFYPEIDKLEETSEAKALFADAEKIGPPGMRFCYELLECPNPHCAVRTQQIIQCFKFFSRRSPEEKKEMTCSGRECDQCFYKRGWEIGLLGEHLFADIIEKKKLNLASADRVRRNTLVEMYLSELSKKPLSRDEEYKLAQKIAGDQIGRAHV
jgi:hypothetical protein